MSKGGRYLNQNQPKKPKKAWKIVLIVLAVKLDNSLIPSSAEETADTLRGLITLLEKGTGVPSGTLDYLSILK